MKKLVVFILFLIPVVLHAQGIRWATDGESYYKIESDELVQYTLPANTRKVVVSQADLTPQGQSPLKLRSFSFSQDGTRALIYTNSKDFWIKT